MTARELIVLGDTTLGGFARELAAQCRAGRDLWDVSDAGFDSWERELHDPASATRARSAAALGFVLSPRLLEGEAGATLVTRLRAVLEILAELTPSRTVLFANVFHEPRSALPLTEAQERERRARAVCAVLDEFSAAHSWFYVVDHVSLAVQRGIGALNEARYEALGALYFSPAGTRHLAALWARSLAALTRTPAKVLVVDLDNVLWGGILGEDGANGLKMRAPGVGHFYRQFQSQLLALKRSGVLLAACSKNNPADAEAVLSTHPDCLLRPADFAAMEISWEPKSAGLRRLAAKLRLGLDSFVFVDDSPFEREEVRAALPEVRVPEFPEDPSGLVAMLAECVAFDRLRITAEDALRARDYSSEAQREALRTVATTPADFYRSLQLKATLQRAREQDFERLHQLIHKTNQFNLTTERLSAEELRGRIESSQFEVYGMRVADRFGDSGLVGLAIVDRRSATRWQVENFLLSCRVIGRTIEHAFVAWLAERAANSGARSLAFRFIASPRNQVAQEFLGRSGLTRDADGDEWSIELGRAATLAAHYVDVSVE